MSGELLTRVGTLTDLCVDNDWRDVYYFCWSTRLLLLFCNGFIPSTITFSGYLKKWTLICLLCVCSILPTLILFLWRRLLVGCFTWQGLIIIISGEYRPLAVLIAFVKMQHSPSSSHVYNIVRQERGALIFSVLRKLCPNFAFAFAFFHNNAIILTKFYSCFPLFVITAGNKATTRGEYISVLRKLCPNFAFVCLHNNAIVINILSLLGNTPTRVN